MTATVDAQVFGLNGRESNTTLQLPQNPPVYGYTLSNVFSGFGSLIMVTTPPGETNRAFAVDRSGRINVITNLAVNNFSRPLFLNITNRVTQDFEHGLLGMAFHPGYATNGYFYVFYSYTNTALSGSGAFNRLSRFQVSPTNQNLALTNELILFSQFDDAGNHNAGDIHFGPDGYLYVAVGDEGDQLDLRFNSQRIDKDFFSGILRIDVDKRATNLPPNPHPALLGETNYFVPSDNPFVGATQFNGTNVNPSAVRTEFWAVGLRNPWRFSFDPADGTIYCGDVGMTNREEINVIVKGGNYGWVWREGTLPGPSPSRQGPANFSSVAPVFEYGRGTATNQGNCVIGGVMYRGSRIPQLTGKYIFADLFSGNLWALTPNGTNTSNVEWLLSRNTIFSFANDPRNGDVWIIQGGGIWQLTYGTNTVAGSPLPATLADTGAFTNLATLTPHAGIVAYDINVPFWSDHAQKTRWFSLSDTNQFIGFAREDNWSFPTGTVWIKHFELELTNGVPSSARRLETRFLVRNLDRVYGVTYRWGSSTNNATLVPLEGMDESFIINDGGTLRTQVWHYPARHECLSCHNAIGGLALGFNTAQLNREFNYAMATDNQIRALDHAGYFAPRPSNLNTLRSLAAATNQTFSIEYRARSYLAANCQQCHQPGGSALGDWDARIENPLSLAGLVNGALVNNLGDPANRVITPGDAAHSVILRRISQNGALRMPPLASSIFDSNAIALVTQWIGTLSNYQTFIQWQTANFESSAAPLASANDDFDGDGLLNFAEYLLGTNPKSFTNAWLVDLSVSNNMARINFPRIANRGFEVQYATNLAAAMTWHPLDVPQNAPMVFATNQITLIFDPIIDQTKFYRVRVFEP